MNRINAVLFSAAFTAWVRETWPGRPEFVATVWQNLAPQLQPR